MPDALVVVLVFIVGPLALVFGIRALLQRRTARFRSDGAVAETFVAEDGPFAFTVPAGGPLGIYVEYSIRAVGRGGGGISYGLVLRLDVERGGASPFEQRGEYLIGQAQRLFGEVAPAQSLESGPLQRSGLDLRRALLLARVPSGDALHVSGKVKRTGGEAHGLHVFARPWA